MKSCDSNPGSHHDFSEEGGAWPSPPGEPIPGQVWPEVLPTSVLSNPLHCVSNPTASHLSANVSLLVSSISPFYLIICISNQTYYAFFYFKNKPSFLTPFPSSCCILAGSQGLGAGVAEQIRKAQKLGPFYLQACSTQPSPSH